MIDLCIICAY